MSGASTPSLTVAAVNPAGVRSGDEAPPWTAPPLTITDFVRYQGASGDMNPIHHDTDFAQDAGFPTPFAVGMLQAGVLATYLTDWLGAATVRRFAVRFREQAWPGDELTYSGKVVQERTEGGVRMLDLALAATRQTGGVHLTGEATVAVGSS